MIDVVYFCGRFAFVGFKIVLHFRVVLRLWNRLSYVRGGVYICVKIGLRLWAFYVGGRVYSPRTPPRRRSIGRGVHVYKIQKFLSTSIPTRKLAKRIIIARIEILLLTTVNILRSL